MKFMSIDYYTSGVSDLRYHKGDLSILASKEEKEAVQKKAEEIILNIPKGFTSWSKMNPYSYMMH